MAWGDFAGAAVDGFSGGLAISDKLRAQKEALRQEAVKRAAATYMSGGQLGAQPGPQPPMPGQSSAPPQQMSIPGAQPMPQAAPPPPAPMAGAAPGGPPPMTGGGGPPPPGMGAPPPGGPPPPGTGAPPPGPPTGAGGTPMSATAAPQPQQPGQDPLQQQSSQTLASIAEGIKKANPGIDMLDLFDATEATIGQMKGVSDALKNQMVYDTNTAKLVFGLQELMAKIQSNDRNVDVKALAQQVVAQTRADAAEDVAGTNAGARVEAAKIGGKSRTDAADITGRAHITGAALGADSRRDVADTNRAGGNERARIGADSRRDVAKTNKDARDYAADRGYDRGVDSAGVAMGKPPTRGGGGGGGGGSYGSASDVAKAYKAGKLTHNEASKILRDNGWAK